jgi:hypothetical protein
VPQANECWEASVVAEEKIGQEFAGRPSEDFRQLKAVLRMLEQRIAQEIVQASSGGCCD